MPNRRIRLVPFALAVALLAGCGNAKPPATQVAARVNSDEITVHQINNVLARAQGVTPDTAPQAKREILGRLVDQQLARQQALDKKLDRTPAVMQAIEAAKSEILARAYLEQIAAAQPKPTPQEVKQYYAAHPELFAQRRLFNLEEIAVAPQDGLAQALREQVAKGRSMQDIAAWLKGRDAKFAENHGARAAEQIPLEVLPKLQAMKEGEIQAIEGAGPLYVVRVLATKAAPVDEAAATPRIQQFLFNQRSSAAIAAQMKLLKDKAKIAYVGEFDAAAQTNTAAESKPAAKAEPPAAAPSEQSGMEKGIRGLKK